MITFTADMQNLMAGIAKRDQGAFESFYDCTHRPLLSAILSVLRCREDAEEILLETYMMVWDKAASFDVAKGSAYGWVLTMARNRAIDRLRSHYSRNRLLAEAQAREEENDFSVEDQDPFLKACLLQRMGCVQSALEKIPCDQRSVIEEAYLKGFSQSEVAENLELPLGTVKTRTRMGMRSLRVLLAGWAPVGMHSWQTETVNA